MSGIRWSDEETKNLIELYKSYTFLWDSSRKMYKKGQMRNYAYIDILNTMGKPGLTIRDIRCKIKNLRSAYYQEIKKRSAVENAGKEYVSGLSWFDSFNDIMEIIQKNKKHPETEADGDDDISDGEGFEISESARENCDTTVVSIKQEFLDEMEDKDVRYCPIVSEYMDPIETNEGVNKKKRRGTYKRESNQDDLDEFQLFANNMAEQLRNMPLDTALNLQVEVQAVIAKERIDMLKNDDDDDDGEDDEIIE
ncbi:uncharacterized protein LOC128671608 [Plodia interpunctella]|uniref:uncharacterized protein LOC128671608 n=1 Tax=Plodia interpunctella TaxID=58824 RepID=UPI0023687176|nr:uncharacterized protein LOC128671608 [Plodia interpunctella]